MLVMALSNPCVFVWPINCSLEEKKSVSQSSPLTSGSPLRSHFASISVMQLVTTLQLMLMAAGSRTATDSSRIVRCMMVLPVRGGSTTCTYVCTHSVTKGAVETTRSAQPGKLDLKPCAIQSTLPDQYC